LRVVDLVPLLASVRCRVDQTDPVKDTKVFGDRLPRHRQLLPQTCCGAVPVDQQQVQHAAPGRVPDGRPQRVVDVIRRRLCSH